jgi:hypothetical protein
VQEVIPVRRKNPYSLVDVNDVSVQAVICGRVGQKAAVGVDVAKEELVVCVVWPDREFERPWRVKSPSQLRLLLLELGEIKRTRIVFDFLRRGERVESLGTIPGRIRRAQNRDLGPARLKGTYIFVGRRRPKWVKTATSLLIKSPFASPPPANFVVPKFEGEP